MAGLLSIIPVSLLLAATFLVLAATDKLQQGILRTFGTFIAVLLIVGTIAAAIVTVDIAGKGKGVCPMMGAKKAEKCCSMKGMKKSAEHLRYKR